MKKKNKMNGMGEMKEFHIEGFTHFVFERESSVSLSSLHRNLCLIFRESLAVAGPF